MCEGALSVQLYVEIPYRRQGLRSCTVTAIVTGEDTNIETGFLHLDDIVRRDILILRCTHL